MRGPISVTIVGALVVIVAWMARYEFAKSAPINGDEAVQGVAAIRFLRTGDFPVFFPSQAYGGTLEVIPQALLQTLDEGNLLLLRLPLFTLQAASCLLIALLVFRTTRRLSAMITAGALASVGFPSVVAFSSYYSGGYALGIAAALLGALLIPRRVTSPMGLIPSAILIAVGTYQQPLSLIISFPFVCFLLTQTRSPSISNGLEADPAVAWISPSLISRRFALRLLLIMLPAFAVVIFCSIANAYLLSRGLIFNRFQSTDLDLAGAVAALMPVAPSQIQPSLPYQGFSPIDYIFGNTLFSEVPYISSASRYLYATVTLLPGLGWLVRSRMHRIAWKCGALRNLLIFNFLTLTMAAIVFVRLLPANQYAIFLVPGLVFSLSVCVGLMPRRARHAATIAILTCFGGWFLSAPSGSYSSQINDALADTASSLATTKMVFVGDYWTITPLQFLSGDRLIAITAPERFPSDAMHIAKSSLVDVAELELTNGPSKGAVYPLRSMCNWSNTTTQVIEANLRYGVCPSATLRLGMPSSFQG